MIKTDILIIGAGPTGLFTVFEAGLLKLKCHLIDALPQQGGQCSEIYPKKPIYDIPAFPEILAGDLVDNLLEQIKPFEAGYTLGERAETLDKQKDGSFIVTTNKGTQHHAPVVVIAGGLGSFEPRKPQIENISKYEDKGVAYIIKDPEVYRNKKVVIAGGGDSALDWALDMQQRANSVLLIHRSDKFKASPASVSRMKELCDNHEMQFLIGNVSRFSAAETTPNNAATAPLRSIQVTGADGVARRVELDHLLVFFGLSPKLGPIAHWGLDLKGNQIRVDTEKFQSSEAGLYAVGDINWYPGKKKLILSGFHEAALAAFAIKEQLNPGKKVHLQYTTTSPVMHERLGVDDPYSENDVEAA